MFVFAALGRLTLLFMPEGLVPWVRGRLEVECPRYKMRNLRQRQRCRVCHTSLSGEVAHRAESLHGEDKKTEAAPGTQTYLAKPWLKFYPPPGGGCPNSWTSPWSPCSSSSTRPWPSTATITP